MKVFVETNKSHTSLQYENSLREAGKKDEVDGL